MINENMYLGSATNMTFLQPVDCLSFLLTRSGAPVIDSPMRSQKVPENKSQQVSATISVNVDYQKVFSVPLSDHLRFS